MFPAVSTPTVHSKMTAGHTSASQHRRKHFLQPPATKTLPQPVPETPKSVSDHSPQQPRVQLLPASPILHTHIYLHEKRKLEEMSFLRTENHKEFSLALSTCRKVTPLCHPSFCKRLKINLSNKVSRPSMRFH